MDKTKILTQPGVERLWAAIEAKFIDIEEIKAAMAELEVTLTMEPLTNPEIDAITGYAEPVTNVTDLKRLIAENDEVAIAIDEDVTLTSPIAIAEGKTVTINLNKDVDSNNNVAFLVSGGNLTINGRGGAISGAKQAVVVQGGTAVVNGGEYNTTSAGQVFSAQGAGSELTLNDVVANGQEFAGMAFDGATLTVNGGEFTTYDNAAFGTNGTSGRGGNTIYINGAKINGNIQSAGYEACGIYVANNDTVIVDGETEINVEGGCGILMRAGNVTVKSGAKINTTAAAEPGWVGDNKTKMSQSGIIYHETANYPGKEGMSLTVESGVIFNVAGQEVEVLSNETTPNVHIG